MTEVAAAAMTRDQAERLTERARLVATTLMEARDKLAGILREANEGRVWEALDMPNIQAWTEFAFSTTPLAQLPREDRRVIVKELAAEGYGTRAIAPVIGDSRETVRRDLAPSDTDVSDTPREVHGRDGITRTFQPRTAPEPVTAIQGYIALSDRLQTERRITTAGALLGLTGITLALLQVLQQLGHLDMATHQRRQLTRRRTGVIDSARQHRLHRDQFTRACLRLTHGRKRGLTGHDYLPPKVQKGT